MSLIESAVKNPPLDLSQIKGLALAEELSLADKNNDGSLSYSEIKDQGITELPTPLLENNFVIHDELDWSVYAALVQSAVNTAYAVQLNPHNPTIENDLIAEDKVEGWISRNSQDLMSDTAVSSNTACAFEIIDYKPMDTGYRLLMKYDDPNSISGDYFLTVGLNDQVQLDDFELGGAVFLFSETVNNAQVAFLKAQLLKDLHVLLTDPLPEISIDFQKDQFEFLEAKMIEANPGMVTVYDKQPSSQGSLSDAKMQVRIEKSEKNLQPVRTCLTGSALDTCYGFDCRSESVLNDAEKDLLSQTLDSLPAELIECLMRNDKVTNDSRSLSLEIMDDDLFIAASGYPWAGAYYDSTSNKVYIRRDQLTSDLEVFSRLLIHEFAHAIPVLQNTEANFFIWNYWKDIRKDMKEKPYEFNRCVTPYALNSHGEMFAENTVAYFAGEEDQEPWYSPSHGPCSRSELREKEPEIYLAMRLFYDEDSPIMGDLSCFGVDSKKVYDKILDSSWADYLLDPERDAWEIYDLYLKFY